MLLARDQTIMRLLINGNQVTLQDAFSYRLSFHARLNNPGDPLPPIEEMLRVKVSASRVLVNKVKKEGRLERLPAEEKLPLVVSAEDTVLGLHDVLNPSGALRLSGSDLSFAQNEADEGSLSFNLLDMTEGGKAGLAVTVTGNGPVTLTGFSGSALSSLDLTVNNYADLVQMIRSSYSGRLVDVLELKV